MAVLNVMVGIPGSGKSTWLKNNANGVIVSRDKIRFKLLENGGAYFSKENEVWKQFINDIRENLENDEIVYADATHINAKSRNKLFNALGSCLDGVTVNAIYIKVPVETAIMRNSQREGLASVPISAIMNMAYDFQIPSINERFDAVYIYEEV